MRDTPQILDCFYDEPLESSLVAAPSHPGVQVIDRDSKTSFDYQIDETSRSDAKAEIAGCVTDYVESKAALCLCLHGWRAHWGRSAQLSRAA